MALSMRQRGGARRASEKRNASTTIPFSSRRSLVRESSCCMATSPLSTASASPHRQANYPRVRRHEGGSSTSFGRSRGGFTSKIHCLGDARGRPSAFDLTPGEAADCKSYDALIDLPEARCSLSERTRNGGQTSHPTEIEPQGTIRYSKRWLQIARRCRLQREGRDRPRHPASRPDRGGASPSIGRRAWF